MAKLPGTIPDRVKVCATIFNIEFIDDLRGDDGTRLDGHIKYGDSKILIENKLSVMRAIDVLMHEVMHAISDHAALGLTEKQIERLSNLTSAVLVDNPEFLELWRGRWNGH